MNLNENVKKAISERIGILYQASRDFCEDFDNLVASDCFDVDEIKAIQEMSKSIKRALGECDSILNRIRIMADQMRLLYEPQGNQGKSEGIFPCSAETADSDNKAVSYSEKQADSDNKEAPHQSQVHVHQEYQVIADPGASNLFSRVNRLLADGWRPQGGIAVEHIDGENDSGYILYQAMVRGLS